MSEAVSDDWLREQIKLMSALRLNKLRGYKPYPKQDQFHALGTEKRERVLLAGNQEGKTWSAAFEASFHATGQYPDDWHGRRWNRANHGWVASESFEVVRDAAQTYLLGSRGEWGTGTIPASAIADDPVMSRNFPGLVDVVKIKHVSGGISTIQFKAYQQGRQKFQGSKKDWIWLDEEPGLDIYGECLARLTASGGMLFMTMTPLLGISDVVAKFYPEPDSKDRGMVLMGIEDALHIDADEREMIISGYAKHEREARTLGIPMLGSGKVFDVPQSDITVEPFPVPEYWPRLNGIDFGYGDHPTGMCHTAWDRDHDCLYLVQAVKDERPLPAMHVSTMRPWGERCPVAWPHDGHRQWGDSLPLVDTYRKEGAKMLAQHATFKQGGNSTEAAVNDLYNRMTSGRFKAFRNLDTFWHEFSTYHRKDGLLVKKNDDVLSALFKCVMMLRFARAPSSESRLPTKAVSEYDPFHFEEAS